MAEVQATGPIPFNYTFGPIKLSFHVFVENVDKGWGLADVDIEYDHTPLELPPDIAAYRDKIIAEKEADAKAKGKVFFDGKQVRLRDYGHGVANQEMEELRLFLKFGPGSYFTHACTGQIVDKECLYDESGNPTTIRKKYIKDPYSWDDCLGNSTGVSTALISIPDQSLVYVERSEKITQYPGRLGTAAAGFMDLNKDMVDGRPNPFHTMRREVTEEMGIKTELGDFRITGLGRPWDDLHAELWGITRSNMSVAEIMGAPKKQKYEFLGIRSVPFEPKDVLPLFRNAEERWVHAHAVAHLHALVNEFGYEKVLDEANRLAAAGEL